MGKLFFKHFGPLESAFIDDIYQEAFDRARAQGLPTLEEQIQLLIAADIWDGAKEKKIKELTDLNDQLKITVKKILKDKEQKAIKRQIEEVTLEREKLIKEKNGLIGMVAETYANRKINEYYILNTLCKDEKIQELKYTPDEYEELNDEFLSLIYRNHEMYTNRFAVDNLKRVALSPQYMNLFAISEDNPLVFYGKPIVNLTFYQCQTFEFAKSYKNIIANSTTTPPEYVLSDPEKLIEWYESTKEADKLMNQGGGQKGNMGNREKVGQVSSMVGVSKENLKKMGYEPDPQQNKIVEMAKKHGGSLNINQLMSLNLV